MRVTTTSGVVAGRDGVFWDIPYAAPPRGAARFAAPQPVVAWSGIRDAAGPGPSAPMPDRRWFGRLDMGPIVRGWVAGEDYLTVNVWTPSASGAAPVMVYVHGGAFVSGSGAAEAFDGSSFARDGVVLVTLNYRLGVPGWLSLPGAPENRGLLDVIAALRWVRENIAGFGGDPARVTVFGQSAGGMIVSALLGDPRADGLFRAAISQSGGLVTQRARRSEQVGRALAEQLGVAYSARAFAEVSDERLIAALPRLTAGGLAGLSPFAVREEHASVRSEVALLVGNTSEEARLYQAPDRAEAIDEMFRAGTERLVRAHGDAYRYLFDWRGGPYGACHAVELPFVFQTTQLPAFRSPAGLLGPRVPADLSAQVHAAWVSFATSGDPGWQGLREFTG